MERRTYSHQIVKKQVEIGVDKWRKTSTIARIQTRRPDDSRTTRSGVETLSPACPEAVTGMRHNAVSHRHRKPAQRQ